MREGVYINHPLLSDHLIFMWLTRRDKKKQNVMLVMDVAFRVALSKSNKMAQ